MSPAALLAACGAWLAAHGGSAAGRTPLGLSLEAARAVLWAVAGAGALAWLLALRNWLRIRAEAPGGEPGGPDAYELVRSVVLRGAPADLGEGLTKSLASPGRHLAPLTVRRAAPDRIEVTPSSGPSLRAVPGFGRCRAELRPAGPGSTEVTFRADFSAVRGRTLRISGALLAAGLAWLAGLTLALHFLVAGADQPAVRMQVVQIIHICHLLWPPWLVHALYRRSRRAAEMFLDAAAANASALAEAFAAGRERAARRG